MPVKHRPTPAVSSTAAVTSSPVFSCDFREDPPRSLISPVKEINCSPVPRKYGSSMPGMHGSPILTEGSHTAQMMLRQERRPISIVEAPPSMLEDPSKPSMIGLDLSSSIVGIPMSSPTVSPEKRSERKSAQRKKPERKNSERKQRSASPEKVFQKHTEGSHKTPNKKPIEREPDRPIDGYRFVPKKAPKSNIVAPPIPGVRYPTPPTPNQAFQGVRSNKRGNSPPSRGHDGGAPILSMNQAQTPGSNGRGLTSRENQSRVRSFSYDPEVQLLIASRHITPPTSSSYSASYNPEDGHQYSPSGRVIPRELLSGASSNDVLPAFGKSPHPFTDHFPMPEDREQFDDELGLQAFSGMYDPSILVDSSPSKDSISKDKLASTSQSDAKLDSTSQSPDKLGSTSADKLDSTSMPTLGHPHGVSSDSKKASIPDERSSDCPVFEVGFSESGDVVKDSENDTKKPAAHSREVSKDPKDKKPADCSREVSKDTKGSGGVSKDILQREGSKDRGPQGKVLSAKPANDNEEDKRSARSRGSRGSDDAPVKQNKSIQALAEGMSSDSSSFLQGSQHGDDDRFVSLSDLGEEPIVPPVVKTEKEKEEEEEEDKLAAGIFKRRLSKEEKSMIQSISLQHSDVYEQMEYCTPFEAAQYAERTRLGQYDIKLVPERVRKLVITSARGMRPEDMELSKAEIDRILAGNTKPKYYRMKMDTAQQEIIQKFVDGQEMIRPKLDDIEIVSDTVYLTKGEQQWLGTLDAEAENQIRSSYGSADGVKIMKQVSLELDSTTTYFMNDFVEIFLPDRDSSTAKRMHNGIPGNWRTAKIKNFGIFEDTGARCAEICVRNRGTDVNGKNLIYTLTIPELRSFVRRLDLQDMERFVIERPDCTWAKEHDQRRLKEVKEKLVEILLANATDPKSQARLKFVTQKEIDNVKQKQKQKEEDRLREEETKKTGVRSISPELDQLSPTNIESQYRYKIGDAIFTNKERLEYAQQLPNLVGELKPVVQSPGGTYKESAKEELYLLNADGTLNEDMNLSTMDWSLLTNDELEALAKIQSKYLAEDFSPRANLHAGVSSRRLGSDEWRYDVPKQVLDRPIHRSALKTGSEPPTPEDDEPFEKIRSLYETEFLDFDAHYEHACYGEDDRLRTSLAQKLQIEKVRKEMQAKIDRKAHQQELLRKRTRKREEKDRLAKAQLPPSPVGRGLLKKARYAEARRDMFENEGYIDEAELKRRVAEIEAEVERQEQEVINNLILPLPKSFDAAIDDAKQAEASIPSGVGKGASSSLTKANGLKHILYDNPLKKVLNPLKKDVPHPIVVETGELNVLRVAQLTEIMQLKKERKKARGMLLGGEISTSSSSSEQMEVGRQGSAAEQLEAQAIMKQKLVEEDIRKSSKLSPGAFSGMGTDSGIGKNSEGEMCASTRLASFTGSMSITGSRAGSKSIIMGGSPMGHTGTGSKSLMPGGSMGSMPTGFGSKSAADIKRGTVQSSQQIAQIRAGLGTSGFGSQEISKGFSASLGASASSSASRGIGHLWKADPEFAAGKRDSETGMTLMFDPHMEVTLAEKRNSAGVLAAAGALTGSSVLAKQLGIADESITLADRARVGMIDLDPAEIAYKRIIRPAGVWYKDQQKTFTGKKRAFLV